LAAATWTSAAGAVWLAALPPAGCSSQGSCQYLCHIAWTVRACRQASGFAGVAALPTDRRELMALPHFLPVSPGPAAGNFFEKMTCKPKIELVKLAVL